MTRAGKWLIAAPAALALILAADFAGSLAMKSARVDRALTARLEASFGRPVQVDGYEFSLWGGPRIEADSVTVGEDPRFGREYFLRARQVSVTLRWRSLLRGRLAFSTFTLEQPSLNVVTAQGRWNLADWLPHPISPGVRGSRSEVPLLDRLEIDDGRINFKRGDLKLPFALVHVSGTVDQNGPGRWSLSLEAQPLRAAVNMQDAGTLRLSGQIGGTSARLRPANLQLLWEDASLSDVLRLATGSDYGMRGRQDLLLRAGSTGGAWLFELQARSRGLHRWDLVSRPGNPAVNVRLAGSWSPDLGSLQITGGRIEAPQSLVSISGQAQWPVVRTLAGNAIPAGRDLHLHFVSDGVAMEDLLAWYRSFHVGISSSLEGGGWLQGSLDMDGWPPRLQQASITGDGLRIQGAALPAPINFSQANFRAANKTVSFSLHALDFGRELGQFKISGLADGAVGWSYRLDAAGSTPRLGALAQAVQALGAGSLGYWNQFTGAGIIQLRLTGRLFPRERHVRAAVDFQDAVWTEPSLPARVRLVKAQATLNDNQLRIKAARANALGASWSGWLQRSRPGASWKFSLNAGRLDARALAARLNPQPQRPGLLERIFGIGRSAGPAASWLAALDASGRLAVHRLEIAPLFLDGLQADVTVHDGSLALANARARFSGGNVAGDFRLGVARRIPSWNLTTRLDNVDLAAVSAALENTAVPAASGRASAMPASSARGTDAASLARFSGRASGTLVLSASGATAAALRESLRGDAQISVRSARDGRVDWIATLDAGHLVPGDSSFRNASVRLQINAGKIGFQNLVLSGPAGRVVAGGAIDFAHGGALAIEARVVSAGRTRSDRTSSPRIFQVTGSPATPRIQLRPAAATVPSSASIPPRH